MDLASYHHLDVISQIQELTFNKPMSSLSVQNLGSTVLLVKVNTLNTEPIPVELGPEVRIDGGLEPIHRMFYYVLSGITQAQVKSYGI